MGPLAILVLWTVSVGACAQSSMGGNSFSDSSGMGMSLPSWSYMSSYSSYMPPYWNSMQSYSSYMPPYWSWMQSYSSNMPPYWSWMQSYSSYMPPYWSWMQSYSSYMSPYWSSMQSYSSSMPPYWSWMQSYWSYMPPYWSSMPASYWPPWSYLSYPQWNSYPYIPPTNTGHVHDHNYQMTCWQMGYDVSDIERHVDCLEFLITQQHMFTRFELEHIKQTLDAIAHEMDIDSVGAPGVHISEHVRLVDGPDQASGRVEIFHGGRWGTVCDDSWDDCDARVVCRMLGYNDGRAFQSACFGEGWGGDFTILLDEVHCSGQEHDLLHCPSEPFNSHDCSHSEDAGVTCWNNTSGMVPQCNPSYQWGHDLEQSMCVWGAGIAKREADAVDKRDTRAAGKRATFRKRQQAEK